MMVVVLLHRNKSIIVRCENFELYPLKVTSKNRWKQSRDKQAIRKYRRL